MPQSELFHDFFCSNSFSLHLQVRMRMEYHDWLTDYSTTEIQTTLPSSKRSLSSGILVVVFADLLYFVTHTFFSLYTFLLGSFYVIFFVGYIEGTESRQYSCTTETVVLISSLSRSISGSNWVRGCVLCECEGFFGISLVTRSLLLFIFFSGRVNNTSVCVIQSA